jgi:6-phosphogluconolactonase (cycloisomerase 2 family)
MFAYVGGYTTPDRDGRGKGINVYRIDPATGAWSHLQHIGGLENPSLFTLRRDTSRVYSVHGGRTQVTAFARDASTGRLTLLNQLDGGGTNPVDAALDPEERHLIVGNYGSGSVAVMKLDADGRLLPVSQSLTLAGSPGPDPEQQAASHPHAVVPDPSGRFVVVPDKGFDRTFVFRVSAGRIAPTAQGSVPSRAGAAPRHAAFHPALPVLYVNNELDSTVAVFGWDATTGAIEEHQVVSTIPNGFAGRNTTAEIAASPDGRFLYVSNRGEDSVVQFSIGASTGALTYVATTPTGGAKPRFFTLDPSGASLFAANQDSDDITWFGLDSASGRLVPRGVVARVGSPSAISLVPESAT